LSISEAETRDTHLLRRVDRVIGDLRRGVIAIVHGETASLALQAAETASADSLAQLATLGGGKV
jgi:hypothetical protein